MRVAAIDIGTVTSRLLVADVDASGTRQVARQSAITNLGEGVDASGEFLPEAIDRTVAQVAEYRKVIDACAADCAVDRVVALATSASRDARNSGVFVSRLREVGVELSVIPGEREAALSFLGASNDFRNEDLLFADIGGGSTEMVFGRANGSAGDLVPDVAVRASHSFNIGCRRMTERFLPADERRACCGFGMGARDSRAVFRNAQFVRSSCCGCGDAHECGGRARRFGAL